MKYIELYKEGDQKPILLQLDSVSLMNPSDYPALGQYDINILLQGQVQKFTYSSQEARDKTYNDIAKELLSLNDVVV